MLSKMKWLEMQILVLLIAPCCGTPSIKNSRKRIRLFSSLKTKQLSGLTLSVAQNRIKRELEGKTCLPFSGTTDMTSYSKSMISGRFRKDRQKYSFPAMPIEIKGSASKKKVIKRVQTRRHVKESGQKNAEHAKIWDQWANWSTCSVTCGIGKLTRWRHCISGTCVSGEKKAQLKTCTLPAC